MSKKPILVMYTMSYYARWLDGVVNRNFHIVNEIEKADVFERVLFIDLLPYDFRSTIRSSKYIYAMDRNKVKSRIVYGGRLFTLSEKRSLFSAVPMYMLGSEARKIRLQKRVIKGLSNGGPVISWSYNPFDLTFLNKEMFETSVFEAVDDWRFHSAYKSKSGELKQNYKTIATKVDHLFCVSTYLSEMFKNEFGRTDVQIIPNTSELVCTNGKEALHKNSVVYLGTIESRFNIEMVEFLVDNNPTKHFTFIGPVWKDQKERFLKLTKHKNVTYKGELVFDKDVAALLPTFDVGIIPHHRSRFSQSNDPLKIYDYLRAGLPVVSTIPSSEKRLEDFVSVVDGAVDFNQALSYALDNNSKEKINLRKDVMSSLTWEGRTAEMLKKITI